MATLCITIDAVCTTSRCHHNADIKRHCRAFVYEFVKRAKSIFEIIFSLILRSTTHQQIRRNKECLLFISKFTLLFPIKLFTKCFIISMSIPNDKEIFSKDAVMVSLPISATINPTTEGTTETSLDISFVPLSICSSNFTMKEQPFSFLTVY